jgi:hypothetical protein
MWVKRNVEELQRSVAFEKKDATFHGFLIGGIVWVLASVAFAGGWIASFNLGFAIPPDGHVDFWRRLPIGATIGLPICLFVFWFEKKRAFSKSMVRNICLKCGTIRETGGASACSCGGERAPTYTMKWIE